MSHLPLSLMNRLESTLFKLWMLFVTNDLFSDYLEITSTVFVPCVLKSVPAHQCSAVMLHFLALCNCSFLTVGNRVLLNPELGVIRGFTPAIFAHEQTQSSRVGCQQTFKGYQDTYITHANIKFEPRHEKTCLRGL